MTVILDIKKDFNICHNS